MRSVCPLSYFLTPLHFGMWELCTTKGKRRRACRRGSALQIRYSLTDEWEFFSPNYIFKDPQQQRDFEERCHDYDRRYTLSALIYRSIEPKWVRKLLIKTSYLWCMGKFCLAICISFARFPQSTRFENRSKSLDLLILLLVDRSYLAWLVIGNEAEQQKRKRKLRSSLSHPSKERQEATTAHVHLLQRKHIVNEWKQHQ